MSAVLDPSSGSALLPSHPTGQNSVDMIKPYVMRQKCSQALCPERRGQLSCNGHLATFHPKSKACNSPWATWGTAAPML